MNSSADDQDDQPPADPTPMAAGLSASPASINNRDGKSHLVQFVSTIKNAEQQVGEHVIAALQHEDTVAVITTVAMGADGQQRIISAALNPQRLQQVQELLQAAEAEREPEEPCVGFHCLIKPRRDADQDTATR